MSNSAPTTWKKKPGDKGFNKEALKIMRKRGFFIGDKLKTACEGDQPFAHTETAAWLAGPETPIDRLLVIHRTGSGKTFAMIRILDLYFSDPRPKVVIFPNGEIVRNFYEKMYKTPTQYTAFAEQKAALMRKANTLSFFKSVLGMEGELHKRGQANELASPLRSLRYSIAGGSQVFSKNRRPPALPIFKIMYDGENPFDNKIVLMDEVHNLIRPPPGTDKRLLKRLERLREALYTAKNSVIVGLTATPFVREKSDGEALLRMIKGRENASVKTNEGFISYFDTLPSTIYPKMEPGASAVQVVKVRLEGENLKKYQKKAKERGKLSDNPEKREVQLLNLMNYCNMAGYYTQAKSGIRAGLRRDPESFATKFYHIVKEVTAHKQKSAILVHRKLGFAAFEEVVKGMDPTNSNRFAFMGQPKTKRDKENNPILAAFNADDNVRGEKIRVLVLDAETFGEGIDLLGVRKFYLAHPAISYALYKQYVGRVLRACGYSKLRPSERSVSIEMYVAVLPDKKEKTADEIVFEKLKKETMEMEKSMHDIFGSTATDRIVLGHP